ncbi:MAG TPA: hypothetical protein DIU07_03550, partial [Rhodobacteraceae bacterium]|nr:hypothetical protein [Paracoccaceae bacterium]
MASRAPAARPQDQDDCRPVGRRGDAALGGLRPAHRRLTGRFPRATGRPLTGGRRALSLRKNKNHEAKMRILAMAGGIAGAVACSQFPEFSQQYVQRLSGATDELRAVTIAFDTAARVGGLTREDALAELQGTRFGDQFSDDMRTRIYRYERLNADYQALASAAPLQRLARVWRIR